MHAVRLWFERVVVRATTAPHYTHTHTHTHTYTHPYLEERKVLVLSDRLVDGQVVVALAVEVLQRLRLGHVAVLGGAEDHLVDVRGDEARVRALRLDEDDLPSVG